MVKRREPKASADVPTVDPRDLENFANAADTQPERPRRQGRPPKAASAKRNHAALSVPFNVEEWELLERAAEATGRPKTNFLRWAMVEKAREILG